MPILSPQCIGGSYQHTSQPQLLELAEHNLRLGSPVMKMRDSDEGFQQVLDMSFKYFFLWWRSRGHNFVNGVSDESLKEEYDKTYEFACELLHKYRGTGKSFFLGNWEGDWYLLRSYNAKVDAEQERIDNMIEWANARQQAVSKAREDVSSDAKVYYYLEANRTMDAYEHNMKRLVNCVLPHVPVDLVSLSSYDFQRKPKEYCAKVLNYVESKLQHPNHTEYAKRVFIGEFGIPEIACDSQEDHADQNIDIARKFKACGCHFILYWSMYNNEFDNQGRQRGFWLVNDKGEDVALFRRLQSAYHDGDWVTTTSAGTDADS